MGLVLLTLPEELLVNLLEQLDFLSLLTCQQVCRRLYSTIAGTASLQLVVELAAAGMTVGPRMMPAAERLSMLKRHQNAWNSLTFAERKILGIQSTHVWELYGGVLSQAYDGRCISFTQLPGHCRGIEEKTWTVQDVGFDIADFGQDPSQDLLVAIELKSDAPNSYFCRVHLLSLHSGRHHPSAPNPAILDLDMELIGRPHFTIIVSGPYLGVMYHCERAWAGLMVWNWTTGQIQLDLEQDAITSFAFLTDKHILVAAIVDDFELVIINFADVYLEHTDIHASENVILAYPELRPYARILEFTIRSDPAPMWVPDVHARVPFYTAQTHRLFVVTLRTGVNNRVKSSTHFIPFSAIWEQIQAPAAGVVHWKSWAPRGTRMIPEISHSSVWVCYVFGQKYVMACHELRQNMDLSAIQVLDFNQRALRRALDHNLNVGGQIIAQPVTITRSKGMFGETVTTSLPCLWRNMSPPPDASGCKLMCSEDNLIVVRDNTIPTQFEVMSL